MIEDMYYNNTGAPSPTPSIDPITASIQAATQIAQTVAMINDADKRRNYEFALNRLTADRQQQLNQDLLKAKTRTEKLQVLANAIATIKAQEVQSRIEGSSRADRNLMLMVIGGGLAFIVVAYLIKKS
jgi:uncharacterized protein (DUF2336 family)